MEVSHLGLATPGSRLELLKAVILHLLVDLHDGSLVSTAVAVVWGTEDGDHLLVMAPVVSVHDQLMRPSNQLQLIGMSEGFADVLAEGVPGSSWGYAPASPIVWVAPEEVTHGALMWNLRSDTAVTRLRKTVVWPIDMDCDDMVQQVNRQLLLHHAT